MSLTSGAPAIDVMRQGLEDLRQLSQHILTTFKVSKQQEEREVYEFTSVLCTSQVWTLLKLITQVELRQHQLIVNNRLQYFGNL